jgi:hypothetical protein
MMKTSKKFFFNNFPTREESTFRNELFIKLFTIWHNFIKITPNPKKTANRTNNLTVSKINSV